MSPTRRNRARQPAATRRERLSSAEWGVMSALWRAGRNVSVQAVRDELAAGQERDYRTIQTLLHRMADKGWVRLSPEGSRVYYTPAVAWRVGIRARARELIAELAEGDEETLEIALGVLERQLDVARRRARRG